jgi:hypothetical protein
VEHGGDELRLAGVAVADHYDVPDVHAFINFHELTPFRPGYVV